MKEAKKLSIWLIMLCLAMLVMLGCARVELEGGDWRIPTVPDTMAEEAVNGTLEQMTEPETEPPVVIQRASFLAAGDSIVHEGIWMEAQKTARAAGNGQAYDFSHLFTEVVDTVSSFDIAFINQETLMAGEAYGYSGYPRFNTPRQLAHDIIDTGFDVVNIANNHMMDMLAEGLAETMDFWDTLDVTLLGAYRNAEDYDTVRIVEQNGITIAFLSYCYGTNGLSMPAGYEMIIPYLNEDVIRRQCAAARASADFVVVSVHWGEDSYQPVTGDQKKYAQLFADCDVDVVVGHHPHLIQPMEWIEGVNGKRMLCAYSLGNLFSLMADAYNMVGGFLTMDFVKEGEDCRLENVCFLPTMFHYNTGFFGQKIYFMEDYSEELAAKHGVQNFGSWHLQTWERLKEYTRDLIDTEFLPAVMLEDAVP
ncbi:MAG: CapA family protein [Clostridia bacterium]|nr:CapA family protein [Clostridia bacterium]